jgi:hypothetical protein
VSGDGYVVGYTGGKGMYLSRGLNSPTSSITPWDTGTGFLLSHHLISSFSFSSFVHPLYIYLCVVRGIMLFSLLVFA